MTVSSERSRHEQEDDRDRAGALVSLPHKSHVPYGPFVSVSWTKRAFAEHCLESQIVGSELPYTHRDLSAVGQDQ